MAVPKKKTSPSRRNMRRSHDHLKVQMVATCPACHAIGRWHHACTSCGVYRGRAVPGLGHRRRAGLRFLPE